MAFRGRGRGRGRGGYGGGYGGGPYGIPEPFVLFPEDVVLPDINDIKEETALVVLNNKLQNYWKSSPYYLEKPTKKSEEKDIERFSDSNKSNSRAKRLPVETFLKRNDKYFPAELWGGKRERQYNQSKGFSFHNKAQLRLDRLMNLEQNSKDQESKGENEDKKENENDSDSEDQEDIEEDSSEESDPDDYGKPDDFADDEDDFNDDQENDNPDDDKIY